MQTSSEATLTASLWLVLTHGQTVKSPHGTALKLTLPYPSWLAALGMQLSARSISATRVLGSSTAADQSSFSSISSSSKPNSSSRSDKRGLDSNSVQGDGKKDNQDAAGRNGGPKTPDVKVSKHICWEPVLMAFGSDSSGVETLSSGREVVRTSPAEFSLWAIEAHGKRLGVLSDPSCGLELRWVCCQCKLAWPVRVNSIVPACSRCPCIATPFSGCKA